MKNTVPISLEALARLRTFESRPIPPCPLSVDGTLEEFYEQHAISTLPAIEAVEYYHEILREHCRKPNALFLVRNVDPNTRRLELQTVEGERYKPTDNAPAWWFHFITYNGIRILPEHFAEALNFVPVHFHEVAHCLRTSINTAEWYVAHIFNVKDGNTNAARWTRADLERRFLRNVHPCNAFYVPNPKVNGKRKLGRLNGEDSRVIAYFRARYADRYGDIWRQFVELAGDGRQAITPEGSLPFSYRLETVSSPTLATIINEEITVPAAAYRCRGRLTFKAKYIEPLADDEAFRVTVEGIGVYQMTKAQFYQTFPAIVVTKSYRVDQVYHGAKLHEQAAQFRIGDGR